MFALFVCSCFFFFTDSPFISEKVLSVFYTRILIEIQIHEKLPTCACFMRDTITINFRLMTYDFTYFSTVFQSVSGNEFGWLIDMGLTALFNSISVYIGPSPRERGRKKRELIDERKMFKQPQSAPTASTVGPCPTIILISMTHRHWTLSKHHRTTRRPQSGNERLYAM